MTTPADTTLPDIESFIVETLRIQSPEELLALFVSRMETIGFEHVAFYAVAKNNQYTEDSAQGLQFHNYPIEFVNLYHENKRAPNDPHLNIAKKSSMPFRWMLTGEGYDAMTAAQKVICDEMRDHGFKDGISVPIYLPGGNLMYCAIGTRKAYYDIPPNKVIEIGYLCHQIYSRYDELTRIQAQDIAILSPRESDVLLWAALGKSNTSIAEILAISPHTVDTLMRRCFQKLGVSNRTSAVLKAVTAGLISP